MTKESDDSIGDCSPYPLTLTKKKELEYKGILADSMFDGKLSSTKVLAFKEKAPEPATTYLNQQRVLYSCPRTATTLPKRVTHKR